MARIKLFYSGGISNSDPLLSIGGNISTTSITSNQLENLFENQEGIIDTEQTDYRSIYLKNISDVPLVAMTISVKNANGGAKLLVGTNSDSINGIADFTSFTNNPPYGILFGRSLSIEILQPDDTCFFWIKRTLPPLGEFGDIIQDSATFKIDYFI